MGSFDDRLECISQEFLDKVSFIKAGVRKVPVSSSETAEVILSASAINSASNVVPKGSKQKSLGQYIQSHFSELSPNIALCSSPKAFRTAWGLRSKTISIQDAEAISNDGGQLLPVNSNSRLLECGQQGVVLGPEKKLVMGLRHSEGNYDDSLDELGRFVYQPPRDASGMLRYRWCQFLSQKLNIPFVVLVIMWFEYRLDKNINQLFVLAPAKLINFDDDLVDLNESIHKPLHLQLIPRHEANAAINLIRSLGSETIDIEVRPELTESLAREWSYDKISSTNKGKQIKQWAKLNSIQCPGEVCNHVHFRDLNLNDIAFGHIISQNWSTAFSFVLDKVHHPDNLYLTCKRCNSSLSDNFPDKNLKAEISKQGTIGDWLRLHEKRIREL